MIHVKKILVTTDLSEESRSAMEYAAWLASIEHSSVTLLYCVDNIPTVAYHTVDLTFDTFRLELLKQERRRLNDFAETLQKSVKQKFDIVMIEGNASKKIIEYAEKHGFDFIVMNTNGRTGIQHAVLGSISEKVVRHAPCPVITIRSTIKKKTAQKPKLKRSILR
jgi:nucleotide-binding universal stress UspA family protein